MTTSYRFDMSWRELPLSQNKRIHYLKVNRLRGEIITEVGWRVKKAKIPRCDRIRVELHWLPVTARARDTDNPAPSLKAVIDGLKLAGVVEDDDHTHVTSEVIIHNPRPGVVKFWVEVVSYTFTVDRLGSV